MNSSKVVSNPSFTFEVVSDCNDRGLVGKVLQLAYSGIRWGFEKSSLAEKQVERAGLGTTLRLLQR